MSIVKFNLAGFQSDTEMKLIVENIERSIIDLQSNTTQIPGRRGHVYEGNEIGAKVFSISCFVPSETEEERVEAGNELSNFFTQLSDGNLYKVYFSDEPNRFYWVYPTNVSNMARSGDGLTTGQFSFDLVAPEGVSYEELETYDIEEPLVNIEPDCNADTPPVIILNTQDFHKDITVSNGESYIHIGKDVEQPEGLYYLNDEMYTLPNGWTKLTNETISFEPQDGVVANNADVHIVENHKTKVLTWGTNPNGVGDRKWYGPARRKDFGKQLENFEIWTSIEFKNYYPRAFNKFELYFIDNLGNRIGKLYIKDDSVSMKNVIGIEVFKDGDKHQVGTNTGMGLTKTTVGSTKTKNLTLYRALKDADVADGESVGEVKSKKYYLSQDTSTNEITNFIGVIGLRKVGNKYTAGIQYMDVHGKPYGKLYTQTFTDIDERFGQKVAGLVYFFGKKNIYEDETLPNPTPYTGNYMTCRHIRVKELTENGKAAETYVAEPGDEIIIDCGNKKVYKNGELYMEDLHIGSKFFTLKPGQENILAFEPAPDEDNIWTIDVNKRNH